MTILGLNSPELFILLVITLVILGPKRLEKLIERLSLLLKFLLSKDKEEAVDVIKEEKGVSSKAKSKEEVLNAKFSVINEKKNYKVNPRSHG